jgi:hypothetical protein
MPTVARRPIGLPQEVAEGSLAYQQIVHLMAEGVIDAGMDTREASMQLRSNAEDAVVSSHGHTSGKSFAAGPREGAKPLSEAGG